MEQLLVLSGIYREFEAALHNPKFKADWSLVGSWNEDARYLTGRTTADVKIFVISTREIMSWIKKHL